MAALALEEEDGSVPFLATACRIGFGDGSAAAVIGVPHVVLLDDRSGELEATTAVTGPRTLEVSRQVPPGRFVLRCHPVPSPLLRRMQL